MSVLQAAELNILCFEAENQLHDGFSLLQMELELGAGSRQTIVRRLPDLVQQLVQSDIAGRLPDIIIMHDASRAPRGDLYDAFSMAAGTNLCPVSQMPAIQALKLLKDPESPYRDIPVLVHGAFGDHSSDFINQGATQVLTSADMGGARVLLNAMAKTLGVDRIAPGEAPFSERTNVTTIIAPPNEEDQESKIVPLEGFQVDQFQNNLTVASKKKASPAGIMEIIRHEKFRPFDKGLSAELYRRGVHEIAENVSSLLKAVAVRIVDENIHDRKEAMKAIDEEVERAGEPPGMVVHVLLLIITAQSMYDASREARNDGIVAELMPNQLKSLKVMLENKIAWLEHTDTLGIAEAAESQQALGVEYYTEETVRKLAALDETAIARGIAEILTGYVSKLDVDKPASSYALYDLLDRMPGGVEHAGIGAYNTLEECIERAREVSIDPTDNLSAAQMQNIGGILDQRLRDPRMGAKTKALLYEIGNRLHPDMASEDILHMVETLAQFRKYGGPDGWPERNIVREVTRALNMVRGGIAPDQPHSSPPPLPPAP